MLELALAACMVVGVADGDTLIAHCTNPQSRKERITVRVAAIDAPEMRQAFGPEAHKHLKALCHNQEAVFTFEAATDITDNYIAHVRCQDQDVAAVMVAAGYAWAARDKMGALGSRANLLQLESDARSARRGLWQDLDTRKPPIEPQSFRKSTFANPKIDW